MSPAEAIAALDAALARNGEDVRIIRRQPLLSVDARARVDALSANDVRPGLSGKQGTFRAILSPTALAMAAFPLPMLTSDWLLWGGVQRAITFVRPQALGSIIVRYEIDFVG